MIYKVPHGLGDQNREIMPFKSLILNEQNLQVNIFVSRKKMLI
jgi:hypothetical protein